MKTILVPILLLLAFPIFAMDIFLGSEKSPLVFTSQGELEVAGTCRNKSCEAIKTLSSKEFKSYQQGWVQGGENPTSSFCKHVKATPKIGRLTDGSEISLCYFSDGSIVKGWDLLRLWRSKAGN